MSLKILQAWSPNMINWFQTFRTQCFWASRQVSLACANSLPLFVCVCVCFYSLSLALFLSISCIVLFFSLSSIVCPLFPIFSLFLSLLVWLFRSSSFLSSQHSSSPTWASVCNMCENQTWPKPHQLLLFDIELRVGQDHAQRMVQSSSSRWRSVPINLQPQPTSMVQTLFATWRDPR